MPVFSSPRERRLWFWVLAAMAAIYATLGLAGQFVEVLRDRGLLDTFFVFSSVLVLIAILTQGLKVRPGGVEVTVGLGIAVAYLMIFVRMGIPLEERTHLIEYGVVALLVYEALMERAGQGRRVPRPALLALLLTIAFGIFDEVIQAVLPNRVFDVRDIGFNTLAALMAIAASFTLSKIRGWLASKLAD